MNGNNDNKNKNKNKNNNKNPATVTTNPGGGEILISRVGTLLKTSSFQQKIMSNARKVWLINR